MVKKPIKRVLKKHSETLMALPGVVGIAQGDLNGKPCIRVFVLEKAPNILGQLPPTLEGYPVIVEQTGQFQALYR